jgi:iron complex transport system substrate-binding protein
MRVFVFASAISLGLCAGPAKAAPARVASLNLCTDELLLLLAAPEQIVSVTHLVQAEAESPLWRQARRFRRNDGSLLSVAPLEPDLVLTMGGGARDRGRIAARLNIRTLDIPYPQSIADIEQAVRRVAGALGQERRAQPVLAGIAALKAGAPSRGRDAAWLGGGGRSLSPGSLGGQWMALAGLQQRPLAGDRITLEQLLVRPPAVLLRSNYRAGQYSGEQRWLAHPLARGTRRSRTVMTDGRLWTCMGPLMIAEVRRLKAELAR